MNIKSVYLEYYITLCTIQSFEGRFAENLRHVIMKVIR